MKKVVILTRSLLNPLTKEFSVGGVQTYIQDLAHLCVKSRYDVVVYQLVDKNVEPCELNIGNYRVHFFPDKKKNEEHSNQYAFDAIYTAENVAKCLFIIATDWLGIKSTHSNVIHIQHGIAFDDSTYYKDKEQHLIKRYKYRFDRLHNCIKSIRRFQHVKNTVCVDYNFFNWYRTMGTIYPDNHLCVIPNYSKDFISESEVEHKLNNRNKSKSIIFARRFFDYRGTLLFAEVAERLLKEFPDIEIAFAGDGPLKDMLITRFKEEARVSIFSYIAKDSVQIHQRYDIAVVPTIYSEGTSLALCEAMAAACFPIATHVGGMTNIILDEYNGFLSYPDIERFHQACRKALLLSDDAFNTICLNAYHSAHCSFSREKWEKTWYEYIERLFETL